MQQHPSDRIWQRLKSLADQWARSERESPSVQECEREARRILREEMSLETRPAEHLVEFYTRELCKMVEDARNVPPSARES